MNPFLSLLISFSPFILIIYYFRSMKKRDFVSYYMNNCCKQEFFNLDKDYFKKVDELEKQGKRSLRLCTSCERDKNINILFSRKKDQSILSLRRFMLTDKYQKIQKIVTLSSVALPVLSIVFKFAFKTETYLTEVSNLVNLFIWAFMIYHMRVTTIPKNKTQTSA